MVQEDNSPPSRWPLARVIETYPAKDGLVRVVKIRTPKGEYTRSITKLAILPRGSFEDQQPPPDPPTTKLTT